MARVREIKSKDDLPQADWPKFDFIAESRSRVGGPFAVLLNSPEAATRVTHLGSYLRFESVPKGSHRELAIMCVARERNAAVEWGHIRLARQEGASEAAIDVISYNKPTDGLAEDEKTIINYAREVVHAGRVSPETFAAARQLYDDRGLTDLTTTIGYYLMMSCVLNAFEVEPGPETPRMPQL